MAQPDGHTLEVVDGYEGCAWCTACGGCEESIPTHCPGEQMTKLVEQRVYAGALDYRDGRWVQRPVRGLLIRFTPNPCPRMDPGAIDRWGTG